MEYILLAVAFGASTLGAACGIGGGIIIKPVLDALQVADVATISFLSGCSVLTMSSYSVIKGLRARENSQLNWGKMTPIAVGAAVGGFAGNALFKGVSQAWGEVTVAGAAQSILLCIVTAATICYIVKSDAVQTHKVQNSVARGTIGFFMGTLCSFLGIGGGPINLVVLCYFFSMTNRVAVQSSLYIICISQMTSLLNSLISQSVPSFKPVWLLLMVAGGLSGGMVGRKISDRLTEKGARQLLLGAMIFIMIICVFNGIGFIYG